MSNYLLILVWILFVSIISSMANLQRIELVNGQKVRRAQPIWAFIVFLPLIIWTGYRGYVGDTWAYLYEFKKMPQTFSMIPQYLEKVSKDQGFYLISSIIKCIFGTNEHIYLLIIATIQCYFLMRIYRRYSTNFLLSFFLFVVSTDYMSWLFNGMRQFLAVTIVFGCFELILKKKYILTIIIILLASQIHGSALIVIPFLFICNGEAWNKKTIMFIIATLIIITAIGQFTNVLDNLLQETQYKNVVSDWQEWKDDGTNPLRVLVYSVPMLLSLVGYESIKVKSNNVINFCVNMSIVSSALYLISMFTSGVFIGRLPIYFSLYSYILLPWEIEELFDVDIAKIIYICLIIGFLLFYYYSVFYA